jgi:hypothetical protein
MDENQNLAQDPGVQPQQDQPITPEQPIEPAPQAPVDIPVAEPMPAPEAPVEPVAAVPEPQPSFAEPAPAVPEVAPALPTDPPVAETQSAQPVEQVQPIIGVAPAQGVAQTGAHDGYNMPAKKPKTGLIIGIVIGALLIVGGVVAAILIIPALTSKTLSCSMQNNITSSMSAEVKADAKFSGNTPQSIDMSVAYAFGSEAEAKKTFDEFGSSIKQAMEQSIGSGVDGVDFEISGPKLEGAKIIMSVKADRDTASKFTTALGLNDEQVTIDEFKKKLEDSGYTCKI